MKNSAKDPIYVLKTNREELLQRFRRGEEDSFLHRHAELFDNYFQESFARSSVGPKLKIHKNPYAIIALGGYGRREQCIYSDIDVVVVFKKNLPRKTEELVQEIFYPLWDSGVEIGYAIRPLKECISLARNNFEILTSLIDARFLCGASSIYTDLFKQLQNIFSRKGSKYIEWLLEINRERHERYGDSTYLLEPNVKEGSGGLRDYHAMLWIARAKYQLETPRDLEFFGYLSHDDYNRLFEALDFIWKVRNWIHWLSGRKCDQLYFEYQVEVAEALHYEEKKGELSVERFLGHLHQQMELIRDYYATFINNLTSRKKERSSLLLSTDISGNFKIRDHLLTFRHPEKIPKDPQILLRIFVESASLDIPLSSESKRLVRDFAPRVINLMKIAENVPVDLTKILMTPTMNAHSLDDLFSTGLLMRIIPEFEGVYHRIQHDEYHIYPVHKHLIKTVEILQQVCFKHENDYKFNTLPGEIASEITKPEILFWAGLLHDIGKGNKTGNHSKVGAELARKILRRLGFGKREIDTVAFLIEEHLLLAETATRRDLTDEKTVIQCARKIKDLERLKMLYLLTVADSVATGPKAWNEWSAVLLGELFFKTLRLLEKGELTAPDVVKNVEGKQKEILRRYTSPRKQHLEQLFEQMSPRYILHTSVQDILKHIQLYGNLGDRGFVMTVEGKQNEPFRSVTVCAKDFPGLFSKIAGSFALNNISILSAEVYTWRNGIALDIFKIAAPPDTIHEEEIWRKTEATLDMVLKEKLDLKKAFSTRPSTYSSNHKKITRRPNRVIVDNDSSDFFTIVEVYTYDSPGLLYRVTNTLFRCELDIWLAKIGTKVDQVVDVFYVRDFEGQKVDETSRVKKIEESLLNVLQAPS